MIKLYCILGNNIAIIANMLGCDFSMTVTVLFSLLLHIYEDVTQPLPLNLPIVNKTQDITTRYKYSSNI